jgi:hypothetical protein
MKDIRIRWRFQVVMARPPKIAGKYIRSRQLSFGRATV